MAVWFPCEQNDEGVLLAVAQVMFTDPVTRKHFIAARMLLDTGAEYTLIPRKVVDALSLPVGSKTFALEGFDGSRREYQSTTVGLAFGVHRFKLTCAICDENDGILGMNVIERLVFVLDGPNQRWSIDAKISLP